MSNNSDDQPNDQDATRAPQARVRSESEQSTLQIVPEEYLRQHPEFQKQVEDAHDHPPGMAGATSALEKTYQTMIASMKANGSYSAEADSGLREGLGLPPAKVNAGAARSALQVPAVADALNAAQEPSASEPSPYDTPTHFTQGPKQKPSHDNGADLIPQDTHVVEPADRPSIFQLKEVLSDQHMVLAIAQAMDTDHNHSISKSELLGYVRDHTDEMGISAQTNSSNSIAVIQTDVANFAESLKTSALQAQLAEVKRFDFSHMDVPTMQDVQAAVPKNVNRERSGRE